VKLPSIVDLEQQLSVYQIVNKVNKVYKHNDDDYYSNKQFDKEKVKETDRMNDNSLNPSYSNSYQEGSRQDNDISMRNNNSILTVTNSFNDKVNSLNLSNGNFNSNMGIENGQNNNIIMNRNNNETNNNMSKLPSLTKTLSMTSVSLINEYNLTPIIKEKGIDESKKGINCLKQMIKEISQKPSKKTIATIDLINTESGEIIKENSPSVMRVSSLLNDNSNDIMYNDNEKVLGRKRKRRKTSKTSDKKLKNDNTIDEGQNYSLYQSQIPTGNTYNNQYQYQDTHASSINVQYNNNNFNNPNPLNSYNYNPVNNEGNNIQYYNNDNNNFNNNDNNNSNPSQNSNSSGSVNDKKKLDFRQVIISSDKNNVVSQKQEVNEDDESFYRKDHVKIVIIETKNKQCKKKFYVCDFPGCGREFSRRFNLKMHQAIHNPKRERPFICDKCGKSFCRIYELRRHEVVHSKERKFVCEYCNQKFSRKDPLLRHLNKRCKILLNRNNDNSNTSNSN